MEGISWKEAIPVGTNFDACKDILQRIRVLLISVTNKEIEKEIDFLIVELTKRLSLFEGIWTDALQQGILIGQKGKLPE